MPVLKLKSALLAACLTLAAGSAFAISRGTIGSHATKSCLYSNGTCVFPDGSYWSGCDSSLPSGWVSGSIAEGLCEDLHTQR